VAINDARIDELGIDEIARFDPCGIAHAQAAYTYSRGASRL
jgi:hypothetical protein